VKNERTFRIIKFFYEFVLGVAAFASFYIILGFKTEGFVFFILCLLFLTYKAAELYFDRKCIFGK